MAISRSLANKFWLLYRKILRMNYTDRAPLPHPIISAPTLNQISEHSQRKEPRMLRSGKEVIDTMVDLIHQAKYSIDLQYYSFEADETGLKILDALTQAKKANPQLKVRLLVDNSIEYLHNGERVGTSEDARKRRDTTNELLMQLRDDGILDEVAVTNRFDLKNTTANILHLYSNVLHRDHKKLFLVDARDVQGHPDATPKAIVGSANVNHFHEFLWKDGGRLFEDRDFVAALAEDFEYTARHAEKWRRIYEVRNPSEYFQRNGWRQIFSHPIESLSDLRGAFVRNAERKGRRTVVHKDPQGRKQRDEVVATDSFWPKWLLFGRRAATEESVGLPKQAGSEDMVFAISPYPGFLSFTRNLIRASKRGVDVSLIIPKENNHVLYNHQKIDEFVFPEVVPNWMQNLLRRGAHANLARWQRRLSSHGINVYEYAAEHEGIENMIHFKGMLLIRRDGTTRSINGSLNYSKGPISGMNREIVVATEGTVATDEMVPFVQDLMTHSEYRAPTRSYRRRTKAF